MIKYLKDDDLVTIVAKMMKAGEDRLGFIEKVGNEDDQSATSDLVGD